MENLINDIIREDWAPYSEFNVAKFNLGKVNLETGLTGHRLHPRQVGVVRGGRCDLRGSYLQLHNLALLACLADFCGSFHIQSDFPHR